MDLTDCYPSCSKDIALAEFKGAVSNTGVGDLPISFVERVLEGSARGLPVGPAISHVLADLVLRRLDRELRRAVGGNVYYARYVDDLLFVVDSADVGRVVDACANAVEGSGHSVKTEKTDVWNLADWRRLCDSKGRDDGFAGLLERLQLFLLVNPSRMTDMEQELREHGMGINVRWLAAKNTNSRFQRYLRAVRSTHAFKDRVRAILWESPSTLREACSRVGMDILHAFRRAASERTDNGTARRMRWQTSAMGHAALRLSQLLPNDQLDEVLETMGDMDMPAVTAALMAVRRAELKHVLPFPGSSIGHVAMQWSSRGWSASGIHASDEPSMHASLDMLTYLDAPDFSFASDQADWSVEAMLELLLGRVGPDVPHGSFARDFKHIVSCANLQTQRIRTTEERYSEGEAADGNDFAKEIIDALRSG